MHFLVLFMKGLILVLHVLKLRTLLIISLLKQLSQVINAVTELLVQLMQVGLGLLFVFFKLELQFRLLLLLRVKGALELIQSGLH